MGVKQREDFDEEKRRKEEEEARRLAALANPIRPKTGQQLRNRYLLKTVQFLLNKLNRLFLDKSSKKDRKVFHNLLLE